MSRVTGYFNVLRTVLISILLNGVLLPFHTPAKANELSALGLPQTWQQDWQTLSEQVTAGEIAVSEQGIPAALDAATHKLSDRGVYQVDIRTEQADIPFNQIRTYA